MALIHNVVGPPSATRVLLLVHGYGADERDLGALLPYLDPDGNFLTVLPRGPVAAPPGFAWYDIGGVTAGHSTDPTFLASLQELDDLLDAVCAEHGLNRGDAVVAGFSQGGALAVALGLGASERAHPAAVLAMSSYLPDVEGLAFDWEAARDIPVLVQHGTEDPLIPVEHGGRALATALIDHEVPTTYGEYPMGHSVAVESLQEAKGWLDAVVAGEKPERAASGGSARAARAFDHHRAVRGRGDDERHSRHRRLLGAVVRTVSSGVTSHRADGDDAPRFVQVRQGEHRRRAAARASIRRAVDPVDRALPQRPHGAQVPRCQAASAARSRAGNARYPVVTRIWPDSVLVVWPMTAAARV